MSKKVYILLLCAVCIVGFCGFAPAPAEGGGVALPVVMYHSLSTGRSGDYIVSVNKFEDDIRELKNAGYTTVTAAEVMAYMSGGTKLPPRPVMIVFDDGHYNNVLYGEPILKKYGAKAVINVVGKFADNTEKDMDGFYAPTSYLTWEHIRNINRDVWEVGSHTYGMHVYRPRYGMGKKAGESEEAYKAALRADNDKMTAKLRAAGVNTQIFAFPFGKITKTATQVLADAGYRIMFSCWEKVNILRPSGDKTQYIMLNRFNRRGSYSAAALIHKLEV